MRTSFNGDWILDNSNLVGINLGADFCAEHEWGIKPMQRHFQMADPDEMVGIESRTLKEFSPKNWMFAIASDGHAAILVFATGHNPFYDFEPRKLFGGGEEPAKLEKTYGNMKTHFKYSLALPQSGQKREFAAAWDEDSFGVHVSGKVNVKKLQILFEAIQKCDIAVWLGGSRLPVFDNPGLIIAMPSKVNEEGKKTMMDADLERIKFRKLVDEIETKTNIKERLKATGFEYYALSPNYKGRHDTKYPIVYFLNPSNYKKYHQRHMHWGWITIEKLEDFINGDESVLVTNPTGKR